MVDLEFSDSMFQQRCSPYRCYFFIFGTPVAYLSPTYRCLTVGAVIVIPGCDRSGIKVLLMFIIIVFYGQSSAWRSPSLSRLFMLTTAEIHDYAWFALVTNTWPSTLRAHPPLPSSRKTYAQWRCVITDSYWPIRLGKASYFLLGSHWLVHC